MIPEILTFLLPVGKYLLASTLLALFYLLFYRGKTSYDLSRKYLVSIALVAILLSQFHIIVRTPPVKIVKVELKENMVTPVLSGSNSLADLSVPQKSQEVHSLKTQLLDALTVPNILFLIYGLVTFILIVSFILQYFKIIAMKRKGVVRGSDGFEIVESADIPTPFSFCKTIFVGQNLTGNKRDVVIKHEQWHIRHHHYVDVMVMETLVRLFWFNPVLWWVRKELRNISEFQTDRSVLDEGHELYKYQTIILEEVMEQNPYLANGFNNSFTKKRFIRMKNTIQTRFTLMRRISIIPFLVGVFCLLCFTEGKGETRFVMNEKENPTVIPGNGIVDTTAISGIMDTTNRRSDYDWKVKDKNNLSEAEVENGLIRASENLGLAIDELTVTIKTKNPVSRLLGIQKVIQLLELNGNSSAVGLSQINEQFCASVTKEDLIQTKTDFIQIKKEIDALKLEKDLQVKTQKFNLLALSMLKVNLIKQVLEVQMNSLTTMLTDMMKPMTKAMDEINSEMNENSKEDTNNPEEIIEPDVEVNEYQIKPSQIKISQFSYNDRNDRIQVIAIEKKLNETRVTIAVYILTDKYWISFDKGFTMIDRKSQDRYLIRKVEADLPLNQKICITGYSQKALEFTLVFPPLKKSADLVDLVEFITEEGVTRVGFRISNVRIKDYLNTASAKVYK